MNKNKQTTATIAVILTILNLLRYNLPQRVFLADVFDLLNVYCWLLALVCLYIYEDGPKIKSVFFFGICGVVNALLNESFFVPTLPAWSENIMMLGAINLSWTHYIYHQIWKKKKTNYRHPITSLRK